MPLFSVKEDDRLSSFTALSLDEIGNPTSPPRSKSTLKRRCAILTVTCVIFVLACIIVSHLWQYRPERLSFDYVLPHSSSSDAAKNELPLADQWALVMSTVKGQDLSWTESLSERWHTVEYVMDDPLAEFHVPVNYGREAMAYLTYIIDHYDNLPDVMAFVHGHDRAWHQPEPMAWKLDSLNLTALIEDQYIGFKCRRPLACTVDGAVNMNNLDYKQQRPAFHMLKQMWAFADLAEPTYGDADTFRPKYPPKLAGPSSAQFVATRDAVRHRSLDWWKKYRSPLLGQANIDYTGMDTYEWGLVYERLWHAAFGKGVYYCPPELDCYQRQWSSGVLCTGYPESPLGGHWDTAQDDVQCFRNQNSSIEGWHYIPWTVANYTRDGRPLPAFSDQPLSSIDSPT